MAFNYRAPAVLPAPRYKPKTATLASMKFTGTDSYIATEDLMTAVNAAITLERPLLVKGEPGTGKTLLAQEVAGRARPAVLRVAHQVDHQGAARALRIRRRFAPAGFAARRRAGQGHPQLHQAGDAVGGLRLGRSGGAADRRDRQGGYRVSQRPPARARPDGVLRLRDPGDDRGQAPPGGDHHLEQREGAARRFPPALLLPLHPLPRARHHGADRRGPLSPASRRRSSRRRWSASSRSARSTGSRRSPRPPSCSTGSSCCSPRIWSRRICGRIPPRRCPKLYGALLKNEQDVQMFERLAFLSRRQN